MKKIFSAVLASLFAITVVSCSDEQDDFVYTKNDKISVEMISAPKTTRSASASVEQGEGLYRVSCQGISYDVMMSPSKALKLNSSSSKNGWRTKKLYGFTSTEVDRDGSKGGREFKLAISGNEAKVYGVAPGIYIAKSVLFVNKCKLPENCEITQGEVNENIMGRNPSDRTTRGFSITRSGTDVIVKTAGTLIQCTIGGATVEKAIPVSKEKMEFNIAYLDINEPISDPVGDMKVDYTLGSNTVSVNYTLKFAQNPTIQIRDDMNNAIIKSMAVTNSSTFKNVLLENVQLKYNCRYYVVLADNGKELKSCVINTYCSNGLKLSKVGNRIKVDFILSKAGVNVGIVLYDLKTYTTKNVNLGTWSDHIGTTYIDVPSSNGPATYVATLMVNGVSVDGAQLYSQY